MRSAGVDPDSIATAFAVARDCLAEARELSAQAGRDLALAKYERDLVRRRASAPYPPAGAPHPAAPPSYPVPTSYPVPASHAVPPSHVPPSHVPPTVDGAAHPGGSTPDPVAMPDAAPAPGQAWAAVLAARPTFPDLPGTDLCPGPGAARTT